MINQAVMTRPLLTLSHPWLTDLLIAEESRADVISVHVRKALREHGRVLNGLHRTLRHVGQHCMSGVTEQRNAPHAPSGQRVAIVERPSVGGIGGCDYRSDLGMPSSERCQPLSDVALGTP